MRVTMIVAAADNGVIGRCGAVPWRLPTDLAFFKRMTMGHHVIMGRNTWASLPRPLPGRTNIVLSRRSGFNAIGAVVCSNLSEALRFAADAGDEEAFVIGGSQVYAEALPYARRIYLTRVFATVEGDVWFPALTDEWIEVARDVHERDSRHEFAFAICTLERPDVSVPCPSRMGA